jgi:8-oxo-dGTP pyrophosphatase MutT (NUDIX family)
MSEKPKIYHGNAGAGILFYCIGTKKLLLLYRSEFVNEPHTWALVGGQVEEGEMPENAAVRESIEEIGYKPDNLIQSYIYEDGDFRFYNFISYVEDEFEPKLNWENEDFGWFSIKDIPKNIHFGLENLIKKIDLKKIKYMKIDNYDKSIDELNKLDIDDSFFDVSALGNGGELDSKKLAIIYGLTPYNIIHAHELGGFDRSKLTIITAGLERKYLNKGDIILFTSSDTANKKEKNILLNEFLIALIPEETNSHIANILERYDILPIKYSKDDDLTSKVKRMEYLYFENGGEVALEVNGDCYLVAAKLLLENDYTKNITFIGKPYLVHAEVTGQGKIDGIRYGHAWVEDDFFVYDYSNGKNFVLPKDFYYQLGEVKKEKGKYQRYSKKQATEKMLQTKHYGCWDLDTKYGHGGILLTGGLSENMTDEDIANKYNISTEELSRRIDEGMKVEKEHTNNIEAQRKIAKDHLVEDLDYYKKLKLLESDKNLETNDKVALPDCYVGYDRLKEVLEGQGIQVQKTQEEYSEGGIVVGKRHSESDENGTGERFFVESTGQLVELEGGEIVINSNSMMNDKLYNFEGKKMTAREIASELNHRYGGVRFNSGGKISCGCNKFYYGGELPSATLESLSGGEGVINFKTSQSKNKYKFQGINMTPRQILSKINTDNGGKKF